MTQLFMLAGGIVDAGGGHSGAVSAYVALSAGRGSRLFKVLGPLPSPCITELPSATTIDIAGFEQQLKEDLAEALEAVKRACGIASIARPSPSWVCKIVEEHLAAKS